MPISADAIEPTGLLTLPATLPAELQVRRAPPELVQLPAPDDAVGNEVSKETDGPRLLPPQEIAEEYTEWQPPAELDESESLAVTPTPSFVQPIPIRAAIDEYSLTLPPRLESSERGDESISPEAQELLAEAAPTVIGLPTGAMVSEQAQAKIRRGYKLAQRGAYFAARREFVDVLRMIAEAKDQKHGASRRAVALADGLRALEEAADFAPRGGDVDSRAITAVIIASHRTPVAKGATATQLMPQQLSDLYYRYAQLQLGAAVAGEPAGSMALHALGKLYSQLGRAEPERVVQADRRAFSLQQAALLARDDNHLAAHELGVLLAEAGHYLDSEYLLTQVAMREPHPVVYRNLARIQRKLGHDQLAAASDGQAHALTQQGMGSVNGIQWVDPQTLSRTGDPLAPSTPSSPPSQVAAGPPIPQPRPQTSPAAAPPEPVHKMTRLPSSGFFR